MDGDYKEEVLLASIVEARDATKHLKAQDSFPTTKNYPAQSISGAEVENSLPVNYSRQI